MNIFKKKSLCVALAGIGALGAAGAAQAVNLNPDGLGQVLIYPYYTTRLDSAGNAFNSLLSVVNTTASVKAVKVRFLEGRNSREVLDFNLWLSGHDVWTAEIVPHDDNGGAKIRTADTSCTLPSVLAATASSTDGAVFKTALLNDGAGATADRTREGYVEIIEMTTYSDSSDTAVGVTHDPPGGSPPACPTSDTQPRNDANSGNGVQGGLMGGMTLINVDSGADYTQDAVALDDFATGRNLYANAGTINPDLTAVDPAVSVVVNGRNVFTTIWAGIGVPTADPVSAVLMHDQVMNEYITEEATLSGTDWVLTMPTKRYYYNSDGTVVNLFQSDFTEVGACDDISLALYDREERTTSAPVDFSPPTPQGTLCLPWESTVLTLGDRAVLGSTNNVHVARSDLPGANGWLNLGFFPDSVDAPVHTLIAPVGATLVTDNFGNSVIGDATYFGLPVVGFAVQSFVNGAVEVNGTMTLSNYGGNFVHKGSRSIGVSNSTAP